MKEKKEIDFINNFNQQNHGLNFFLACVVEEEAQEKR